jgi:hypothetical protein
LELAAWERSTRPVTLVWTAIKLLPEHLKEDSELRQRFEREVLGMALAVLVAVQVGFTSVFWCTFVLLACWLKRPWRQTSLGTVTGRTQATV